MKDEFISTTPMLDLLPVRSLSSRTKKAYSKEDGMAQLCALIAPMSLGLALVNYFPRWWQFLTNHGVVDDVSISMEDYNVVEMFLELISVPILLASMLVSVALVYWHDEAKVRHSEAASGRLSPASECEQTPTSVLDSVPENEYANFTFQELLKEAKSAEKDLNVRKALQLYERALMRKPSDKSTELLVCKIKCDLGFLIFDTTHEGPMKQFFTCESNETLKYATELVKQALEGARQLTERYPQDNTAFTLLALCIGRQILVSTQSKQKVRLAVEMHAAAQKAISLNPKDDQAHFMLARWHNDIASLPRVMKTLVRFIYGSSLKGKFENAIASAKTAISLNPSNIVNKVELGRAYTGLGDLASAQAVYKEVIHLEVDDVNAALYRQLALDDIERIESGKPVGSLARPWWAMGT
mmetsp:Transcript_1483/g.4813  ORF Transcript_1483/g.4813 Transcript_1483/m.4813 type:complete len:413 (-) Transcript_1483:4-1242(-)|eukprot:CAMPEP_0197473344 /NCGR_PEP_ID=MMETSP1309-20131121/4666_1 /TAXON_ID=464262 /ORGANISM="Genus nov. species nov., Strain RCC998" /LENGTH=412 /DNA_ID=CAMNT_0043012401 /DNA_START=232 /DNA_END=1470 /DNA_ORIENTATION=-